MNHTDTRIKNIIMDLPSFLLKNFMNFWDTRNISDLKYILYSISKKYYESSNHKNILYSWLNINHYDEMIEKIGLHHLQNFLCALKQDNIQDILLYSVPEISEFTFLKIKILSPYLKLQNEKDIIKELLSKYDTYQLSKIYEFLRTGDIEILKKVYKLYK